MMRTSAASTLSHPTTVILVIVAAGGASLGGFVATEVPVRTLLITGIAVVLLAPIGYRAVTGTFDLLEPIVLANLALGVMFVCAAIWMTPQTLLPDLTAAPPEGVSLASLTITERMTFLGLMMAKALAVTGIIVFTFLTYMIYRRAGATGTIRWGRMAPQGQYALIFLPAVAVYTMTLMGAIRELARQDWHVYQSVRDATPYWFTPTLGHTSVMAGISTLTFFALMALIFWLGFKLSAAEE